MDVALFTAIILFLFSFFFVLLPASRPTLISIFSSPSRLILRLKIWLFSKWMSVETTSWGVRYNAFVIYGKDVIFSNHAGDPDVDDMFKHITATVQRPGPSPLSQTTMQSCSVLVLALLPLAVSGMVIMPQRSLGGPLILSGDSPDVDYIYGGGLGRTIAGPSIEDSTFIVNGAAGALPGLLRPFIRPGSNLSRFPLKPAAMGYGGGYGAMSSPLLISV